MDETKKTVACLVCGGTYEPFLPGLIKCSDCGFVSADLSISDEELYALYGEDYFHGAEYHDYVAEKESLILNFERRIKVLSKLDPTLSQKTLLEIGCAYGYFLEAVKPYVRRAYGMDISQDAVRKAQEIQKVDAFQANYLDFRLEEKVDLIAMWDTIEHLRRPDLFVEKAAADLKPGGLLAITTGDIGSFNARLRGEGWRMIHPPTHMHYFSVPTLSKLLERNGFDVVHVSHPGNSRKLRSILYFILVLRGKRQGLYNGLSRLPFLNLSITLNLFDIMYVVGRRKG